MNEDRARLSSAQMCLGAEESFTSHCHRSVTSLQPQVRERAKRKIHVLHHCLDVGVILPFVCKRTSFKNTEGSAQILESIHLILIKTHPHLHAWGSSTLAWEEKEGKKACTDH